MTRSSQDSSINEGFLSSLPSPFQISHLKDYQHPHLDDQICGQVQGQKNVCAPKNLPYSGSVEAGHAVEGLSLHQNPRDMMYCLTNQASGSAKLAPIDVVAGIAGDECSISRDENVAISQGCKNEIALPGNLVVCAAGMQIAKLVLPAMTSLMEVESRSKKCQKYPVGGHSRYLNLEPSLTMDWLEISWDELHIKEHVVASTFLLFFSNMETFRTTVNFIVFADVAAKVLTVQDIHDDHQFTEFLREVAIVKYVRHPNVVLFMGADTKRPHLSIRKSISLDTQANSWRNNGSEGGGYGWLWTWLSIFFAVHQSACNSLDFPFSLSGWPLNSFEENPQMRSLMCTVL
ncbi:hypothetical protein ACH5RR_027005 [Cinchona calisaya]|uniref:Uncharacterized protein n=1 Tax=Cinchona calisaya TaxID=153742 RepID=A0ABD2Z482_9GENT